MFYFPKVIFILWLCGENVLVLRRYMLRDSRVKYMIPVTFKWFSQKKKKKVGGRETVLSCNRNEENGLMTDANGILCFTWRR